jgi:hypothetical protein
MTVSKYIVFIIISINEVTYNTKLLIQHLIMIYYFNYSDIKISSKWTWYLTKKCSKQKLSHQLQYIKDNKLQLFTHQISSTLEKQMSRTFLLFKGSSDMYPHSYHDNLNIGLNFSEYNWLWTKECIFIISILIISKVALKWMAEYNNFIAAYRDAFIQN